MSTEKTAVSGTIAVIGATGSQGGHVVEALLERGQFCVRAVTRNLESDAAQQLAQKHKENDKFSLVKADLNDVDSLVDAFADCYGVFGVTNFWQLLDPALEIPQIANLATAASRAKIKHFVWSTLPEARKLIAEAGLSDTYPTLGGEWKVPHLDGKGANNHLFEDAGVPTTFVYAGFYWANLLEGLKPTEAGLILPMKGKVFGMNLATFGAVVARVVEQPALIGEHIGVADELLTPGEMAAAFSSIGIPIEAGYVPPDVFASFGFPGADDLANMFRFFDDFNESLCLQKDALWSPSHLLSRFPDLNTSPGAGAPGFDLFLKQNQDQFVAMLK